MSSTQKSVFLLAQHTSRTDSRMYLVDGQLFWSEDPTTGSSHKKRNSSFVNLDGSFEKNTSPGILVDASIESSSAGEEVTSHRIRWCRESIAQLKRQTWPMERKLQTLRACKSFIKQHQGELTQSSQARDLIASANVVIDHYWRHFRREFANFLVIITPWEMRIKKIESHFGSVVASYFTFLRWIFWLNLANSLVLVTFVLVPELIENAPDATGMRKGPIGMVGAPIGDDGQLEPRPEFNPTLAEIWEFEGFLKFSPLFYGYYNNKEISKWRLWRNPLAYLLSIMLTYLLCIFCISRKLSQNNKLSRAGAKEEEYAFCWTVFVGWDFMIGNAETAYNKTSSLVMNLKEGILEEKEQVKDRDWRLLLRRVLANIISVMLIVSSAFVVGFAVQRSESLPEDASLLQKNELQLVMSGIQFIFPPLFDVIGFMECYHPRKALNWQLGRILSLDFLNFYTLMFSLFGTVAQMGDQLNEAANNMTLMRHNSTHLERVRLGLKSVNISIDASYSDVPIIDQKQIQTVSANPILANTTDRSIQTPVNEISLSTNGKNRDLVNNLSDHLNVPQNEDHHRLPIQLNNSSTITLEKINMSLVIVNSTNKINQTTMNIEQTISEVSPKTMESIIPSTTITNSSPVNKISTEIIGDIGEDYYLDSSIIKDDAVSSIRKSSSTIKRAANDDEIEKHEPWIPGMVNTSVIVFSTLMDPYQSSSTIPNNWINHTIDDTITELIEGRMVVEKSTNQPIVETSTIVKEYITTTTDMVPRITTDALFNNSNSTLVTEDNIYLSLVNETIMEKNKSETTTTQEPVSIIIDQNRTLISLQNDNNQLFMVQLYNESMNQTGCGHIPHFDTAEILALNSSFRERLQSLCWETMFGQEMVKIVVMDLVMTVFSAIAFEFLRACFVRYLNRFFFWDLERGLPGYQDFKIAENVLHLVNNQSTVWMGMFFAPGLPAINTIKLAVLMYIRSWAVLTCNIPHETVFKVSKSNNFYYLILLLNLIICIMPVAYAVTWIRPSWHCGPFGGQCRMYVVLTKLIDTMLPPQVNAIIKYLSSPGTIIPLIILLILVIYYLSSTLGASKESNRDLKAQLKKNKENANANLPEITNTIPRESGGSNETKNLET